MASTNNCLNNQSATSIAGATQTFTVSNSDNTSTSGAQVTISVGGTSTTGDAQTSYVITGGQTWSVGTDTSASGNFVIANSATLGTSNAMTIGASVNPGVVSWPNQPAFFAYLGTNDTNATGNGGTYTLGGGNALTKVFDRATNFNTNGTFTAPTTGYYLLSACIQLANCTANTGMTLNIVTTAYTYSVVFNRVAAATNIANNITVMASMTANDTATVTVVGTGEAGNTETVTGSSNPYLSYFNGYLLG